MISCIICSRRPDISAELKENIASTIGCEYELVVIDNSKNEYSIFSAYNEGVLRAKGDVYCFMHEDILYHTQGWGKKVINHFIEENVGLIGIVGTHLLPQTISGWYHPMLVSGGCIQNNNGVLEKRITKDSSITENYVDVTAVDGMWFCVPKSVASLVKFDDTTFSSFHCYDLDICMQIKEKSFRILVVYDILIEHSSLGSFDMKWYEESSLFLKKWKHCLPEVSGITISENEIKIRTAFVDQVMVWQKAYAQCNAELINTRKSYAYRIGKRVTRILKCLYRRDAQ